MITKSRHGRNKYNRVDERNEFSLKLRDNKRLRYEKT